MESKAAMSLSITSSNTIRAVLQKKMHLRELALVDKTFLLTRVEVKVEEGAR